MNINELLVLERWKGYRYGNLFSLHPEKQKQQTNYFGSLELSKLLNCGISEERLTGTVRYLGVCSQQYVLRNAYS